VLLTLAIKISRSLFPRYKSSRRVEILPRLPALDMITSQRQEQLPPFGYFIAGTDNIILRAAHWTLSNTDQLLIANSNPYSSVGLMKALYSLSGKFKELETLKA